MAGLRVTHATERSCTFTLVDATRPYNPPFECGMCGRTHLHKTYHLTLDDVGSVIVSNEIWERLKRLPANGGFSMGNVVERPPDQLIIPGRVIDRRPIVAHPTLKEPN